MYHTLIVEDDPQVAQINSNFLTQSGFSVVGVAADGRQALSFLQTRPVNLILLDIYLPGSNGLQILREIRTEDREIEVIVISAAKDSAQIREAFRLGCLDYIIKPFTYERLRDALSKYQKKMCLLNKEFDQSEVDLFSTQQSGATDAPRHPKGIDKMTLKLVCHRLLALEGPFSAQELAEQTGISRVSAKKYLDFLCEEKALLQTYLYGQKGRPVTLYQRGTTEEGLLERWATE